MLFYALFNFNIRVTIALIQEHNIQEDLYMCRINSKQDQCICEAPQP